MCFFLKISSNLYCLFYESVCNWRLHHICILSYYVNLTKKYISSNYNNIVIQITPNGESEEVFEETPSDSNIKKGLLWQQRDKLFSRWKERYFVLTKDLLQCYKKETSKITDMGGFIFKVSYFFLSSLA